MPVNWPTFRWSYIASGLSTVWIVTIIYEARTYIICYIYTIVCCGEENRCTYAFCHAEIRCLIQEAFFLRWMKLMSFTDKKYGPGSRPRSMWDLWWTKRHWGRFSSSISVPPADHSTNFSIIIITRYWHNRPTGGRSAEWTQLDCTPYCTN
jgi:hypothetical protein